MADPQTYKTLYFRYEILKARLEIHEYFLNESIREIYDNITQSLSLIRVRLALIELKHNMETTTEAPGELVSTIIKNLRTVCQWLSPETNLDEIVRSLVNKMYPGRNCFVHGHFDSLSTIRDDKILILAYITMEVMKLLNKQKANLTEVCVDYKEQLAGVSIICEDHSSDRSVHKAYSDLAKKAKCFGGRMKIKRTGQNRIKINLVMLIV